MSGTGHMDVNFHNDALDDLEEEAPEADSSTDVHIRSEGSMGVWGNARDVHSMRCDNGIFSAFKQRVIALGSSVCSEIEILMVAYLGASQKLFDPDVHTGNTFVIENMDVYRQLGRDRRSLPANVPHVWNEDEEKGALDIAKFIVSRNWEHNDLQILKVVMEEFPDFNGSERVAFKTYIKRLCREASGSD